VNATMPVIAGAVLLLLAIHAPTVREVVFIWGRSGTYKFSWIVAPTFGYLLWYNRGQFSSYQASGSLLGIALALACTPLWIASGISSL
jgi:hypothetical protein